MCNLFKNYVQTFAGARHSSVTVCRPIQSCKTVVVKRNYTGEVEMSITPTHEWNPFSRRQTWGNMCGTIWNDTAPQRPDQPLTLYGLAKYLLKVWQNILYAYLPDVVSWMRHLFQAYISINVTHGIDVRDLHSDITGFWRQLSWWKQQLSSSRT